MQQYGASKHKKLNEKNFNGSVIAIKICSISITSLEERLGRTMLFILVRSCIR
jgi:hypothetical protein